jgi:hypothetical protein
MQHPSSDVAHHIIAHNRYGSHNTLIAPNIIFRATKGQSRHTNASQQPLKQKYKYSAIHPDSEE